MVTTTKKPDIPGHQPSKPCSFEAWIESSAQGMEWVNGHLLEKTGMTLTHSRVQGNLCYHWRRYIEKQKLEGTIYTEAPCQTIGKQGRKPDVAYLTPELVAQYGNQKVLPQSFPLSAEIVSPTDAASEVFARAKEYLETGGQEVWLIFPENELVIVTTQDSHRIFGVVEMVTSQLVLSGVSIAVKELLA